MDNREHFHWTLKRIFLLSIWSSFKFAAWTHANDVLKVFLKLHAGRFFCECSINLRGFHSYLLLYCVFSFGQMRRCAYICNFQKFLHIITLFWIIASLLDLLLHNHKNEFSSRQILDGRR